MPDPKPVPRDEPARFIDRLQPATLLHAFAVIILGIALLIRGELPDDALVYFGIATGGSAGLGFARALNTRTPTV